MASPIATFVSGSLLDPSILVGRFQEVSCLHRPSGVLLVTDALVGIGGAAGTLADLDPTRCCSMPASEVMSLSRIHRMHDGVVEPGWCCLPLSGRPEPLEVPGLKALLGDAFKTWSAVIEGLTSALYPFRWKPGWRALPEH